MSRNREQRTAVRRLQDGEVRVRHIVETRVEPLDCISVEVSSTGMRLLTEKAISDDGPLQLHLQTADGEYRLSARLIWQRETEVAGVYLAGVEFLEDDRDDLQRWQSGFIF